jgi:AcrR family transcriptional regulator
VPAAPDTRTRSARLPRPARRAQLLDAAQQVFVAQGYHATAMDDIAERAGVSKPVLYQHFPGKLELYVALLDQQADRMVAAVREALDSTSDNKQRVAATIAAYFRFVDEEGGAFRLVFESDLTNQEAVRQRVEGVTADCAAAISEVIRDDAGLPDEEARLLAAGLTGMAHVAARYWLTTAGSIPRDAAARLLASLSWRGIGAFPRTGEAADASTG